MDTNISLARTEADFMKEAYKQAVYAYERGEIPIGAVIVCNNKIIARSHNQTEELKDVTAHAEMVALTMAANYIGGKYLNDCDLYVTVEPCLMCAGALFWAQFRKVIYGADDPKQGFTKMSRPVLHPKTEITRGVLKEECENLIKSFFLGLRGNKG
jgi:tRNA(adenine34) deaminase